MDTTRLHSKTMNNDEERDSATPMLSTSDHNSKRTAVGITIDHIFYVPAPMLGRPIPFPYRGIKALSVPSHRHMNRESHAIQKRERREKKRGCTRTCSVHAHKQTSSANHTLGHPRPTRVILPTAHYAHYSAKRGPRM